MSNKQGLGRRRLFMSMAAVGLVAAALAAMGPASAASQDVAYSLTSGSLSVGAQSFTLPASGGFNGTLDDATGDLAGEFVFPVITANITDPLPATVTATLVQQGEASGSIDPTSGEAELEVTLRIGLEVKTAAGALLVGGNCGIGPVTISFAGAWDDATGKLSLSDEGFALPNSSGCQGGLDFGPIIDELLGGDTEATLVLSSSDTPIATTTSTTAAPTSTASTTKPSTTSDPALHVDANGGDGAAHQDPVPVGMVIVDQSPDQAPVVVTDDQLLTG